jgi:putative redox protein
MKTVVVNGYGSSMKMTSKVGNLDLTIDRTDEMGPSSLELLLLSLGACTYATVAHYMERKNLSIDPLAIELAGERAENGLYEKLFVNVVLNDQVPEEQRPIILNVANTCRIHKTLHNSAKISVDVQFRSEA